MKEFIIKKNDSNQRLDKFIKKAVPRLPDSLLYKYIRTKRIKLNGKKCDSSVRLCENDILQLYINDDFFNESKSKTDFLTVSKNLNIIYEDQNIILIDKKNGLVVHEDNENSIDTLINRLKHYLFSKNEYNPLDELSFTPALCNRLDRNTGGIVIAAKNAESLRILNQKIKDREIIKKYLCITVGIPPKSQDTITAFLEKKPNENIVRITDKKTAFNKSIITSYKILKKKNNLALIEILLETGRTHQIRAHMAYIGYPLLGDGKYGINKVNREYKIKTQALYSYKLMFNFNTASGCLDYLNGKEFTVNDIWFENMFF